jgi:hypothetical protein
MLGSPGEAGSGAAPEEDAIMQNAAAFADNDVVTIAWSYGKKPDGCMGFAIYRIDDAGKETALPSHAVFRDSARG